MGIEGLIDDNQMDCDEADYEKDEDTCPKEELCRYFPSVYQKSRSIKITSDESYCLGMESSSKFDKLAIRTSNNKVNIVDCATAKNIMSYKPHENGMNHFKISPTNDSLIYSSSNEGIIKLYDIRTNKCEKSLEDTTSEDSKRITTFDVSNNDRILCAGTELADEDAYLLFWDVRGTKLLGGYWESHSDEITSVKFNPTSPDMMASGSVDGLVNIFDVSKDSEDDAFTYCLNTNSTVSNITWELGERTQKYLISVADTCKFDYWNIEESTPSKSYSQAEIATLVKRKLSEESSVVSIFCSEREDPIVLVSSGMESHSSSLRSLRYCRTTNVLQPHAMFVLEGDDKMPIIRSSLFNKSSNTFITAGEDGFINIWACNDGAQQDGEEKANKRLKTKHNSD